MAGRRRADAFSHQEASRPQTPAPTEPEVERDAWPRYLQIPAPAQVPSAEPPEPAPDEAAGDEAQALTPTAESAAEPTSRPADTAPAAPAPRLPTPPAFAHPPEAVTGTEETAAGAEEAAPTEPAEPSTATRTATQAEPPPAEAEDAEGAGEEEAAPERAETAATGAEGGGSRQALEEAPDDEAEAADEPAPELDALDSRPIAPPPLQWQPLAGEWPLPGELDAKELPHPPGTKTAPAADKGNKETEQGKSDIDKGAAPRPAADDPKEAQRRTQSAADQARRAWQALSSAARREQQAFVDRANRAVEAMADGHARGNQEVRHALDADLAAVDAAASQAAEQIRNAADLALLQLEAASRSARAAIGQAGRNAYGLISAGATRASADIGGVVAGLVAGHSAAYNDAISRAREAADNALLALNEWRDQRTSNFPIGGGAAMLGAKNESLQARIPRWTDPEATRLNQRDRAKEQAWSSSRDSTVCSMSCSFRGSLESDNCQAARQARNSVAEALRQARTSLRTQTRDGRRALRDLRRSSLQQIAVQQRATKSRLTSQTRGTLGGLRGEAQGAIRGVQGAAGGAIPAYWRGADGFRQSLRQVAEKGPEAVNQTAKKAPDKVLAGLRRSSANLDSRLTGNREKLQHGLEDRIDGHRQASSEQREQLVLSLQEQGGNAGQRFDQASAGFVEAFAGLADTVLNAAASWAQPTTSRMAASIQAKRGEAQQALSGLLNGQSSSNSGSEGGEQAGAGGAAAEGCAPQSCGNCAGAAGNGGESGGRSSEGGDSSGPQGLLAQVDEEVAFYDERALPDAFFSSQISSSDGQVEESLRRRAVNVTHKFEGGFAGTVDETGVIAALRGLTAAKGRALDVDSYPTASGRGNLDPDLRHFLGADSNDYAAASAYLAGNAVEGARHELEDSTGFFNDDEARIEAVMRALSPEQSAALGRAHPEVMGDIRDALGGTDLEVFNALAAGNHARADAYRLRDAVNAARRDGNADAVHSAIEQYTGAPGEGDWRTREEVDTEENRAAVVRELGGIVGEVAGATTTDAQGRPLSADQLAVERAVAYVSRDIEVYVGGGPEGEPQTITMRLEGANRDLAGALLRHGPDSVQARVARLGVEMQRRGDPPNPLNIDRAMFDTRFTPDNPNASAEEREANERARTAARADRARVLLLAAQAYAGDSERLNASVDPDAVMADDYQADTTQVGDARQALIDRMGARFGSDTLGAELAKGLLTDERPSAQTAALAMRHAQEGAGTNEELAFRFTERMNRDEIAAMRAEYRRQTGRSLDADLGTYGEGGTFTELSGDDRLRMERALRGVARTDQERLENAAFAIAQQRRETGAFGAWLAEGSLAEQVMNNTESQLQQLAGGPIRFNQHGELSSALANFSASGEYTGTDRDHFRATTAVAQTVAENYASRIDAYADIATTGIAILGAIAAAVITVVTGGAAAPLIAAALIAGLASMSANYAIKGGRYGWEQAAIDLGMTAVQALTAGVGAQLGAAAQIASKGAAAASTASRSLVALSRIFTGNPVVDQIIVGAITGSIGGLGNTVFDERTWEHGGDDAVGALFAGLLKGALSGAATAALTNSVEALGRNGQAISDRARALAAQGGLGRRALGLAGRGLGRVASGLDEALNTSTGGGVGRSAWAMLRRGLARGTVSGLGGMAGRGTEIAVDAARGKYRGDAGNALLEMGQAGLHSFVQGIGEGAGEAVGQRMRSRRLQAAAEAIAGERAERGLEPLPDQALHAAADDLLFLNQHGRNGGDGIGRAINLDHIATHGGLAATVATRHPEPFVEDGMRAALLRHVPADAQGDFADVPIRVMAEAEYHALTRSESGPVVTLIENGQPVVVVREGTPIARLADEGPHLQQTRDSHTRERVARLDEATLARWDSLDLDTQLDLYQNKIELEIDAHQRIADSLAAEQARGGGDAGHLAIEIEHNATTLRNLRERLVEVEALGPAQRTAIAEGDQVRPQYLEQPARLFSKESPPPAEVEARARRAAAEEEEGELPPRRYPDQPDLRGPRLRGEPGSEAEMRQRHEDWMEGLRRGFLEPGTMPPMAEGLGPTKWMSLHNDIESAYAVYDATVRATGGEIEVGIIRDARTGRYMVARGSELQVKYPSEFIQPESVLHFHPDFGPTMMRNPSTSDLAMPREMVGATKRPVTNFIEYDVPGLGRARTAFTLIPEFDPNNPGVIRNVRYDFEYVDPVTGNYKHQSFASRQEWLEHYHARTVWFDPDGPVARQLMREAGLSPDEIAEIAAAHRPPGRAAPEVPAVPSAGRGGIRNAVYGGEPTRTSAEPAPRTVFEPFAGPSLRSARELQERYPGAKVISSEALYPPGAGELAEFQQRGGRFLADRFGESLPDNSVDRMHVRFPLPHSKSTEAHLPTLMQRYPGMSALEAVQAHRANIESIENLGPHALRTLSPDGTMEVVYWEAAQIGGELARLQERVWTDPATGERYRLQAVGPAEVRPRAAAAPHSGYGVPAEAVDVSVMTLRKVRVEEAATVTARGRGEIGPVVSLSQREQSVMAGRESTSHPPATTETTPETVPSTPVHRAGETAGEAASPPGQRKVEADATDPVAAAQSEAAASQDPATQADIGQLPDAAELIAMRAEEQRLQARHDELAATHRQMDRLLDENQTQLRQDEAERDPLVARHQEKSDARGALRQRRDALLDEQERLRLPTDRDITPGERRTFAQLSPEEKQRIRSERQRIDGELREVGESMAAIEADMHSLSNRISALDRRMTEARSMVDSLARPVKRMAGELEGMRARLAEIEARRGVVIGEWAGHFDRIGERPPCFLAGTLVHTPVGLQPIESLTAGDLVYAFDTATGQRTTRQVLRPETGRTERVVTLRLGSETIHATPRHRFWSPERSEWLELQSFVAGMSLLGQDNRLHSIDALEEARVSVSTYNLLVDGEHDYFVGAAGVLAHNGKDPDELSDSIFRDEITDPPEPFEVRFYVIVHADDPDVIIYVGSTEQTLADRLRGHVRDRVYVRGDKAGQSWLAEAGGRVRIVRGDDPTQVRAGKFIMREITCRTCHSHFERFVWELYYIESIRVHAGDTMQNDFDSPPVGRRKFNEFRDYYLTQLCAVA